MLQKNNQTCAVRYAWRTDVCLRQAMDRYREFSKMTVEEVLDRIVEDISLARDPIPEVNAVNPESCGRLSGSDWQIAPNCRH